MRQSVVLIGVCAIVLVGAWLASRALVAGDAPPSGTALVVSPSPSPNGAPAIAPPGPQQAPTPIAPAKDRPDVRAMIDSARSGQLEPVATAKAARPEEAAPEEEPNPFVGESRELDYADRLMWEADGGVERLTSAREVYKRCLDALPDSQRCKDGLEAVQLKLNPPRAIERTPGLPTLKSDAQDPSQVLPRLKP